jgi:hypothetical protein
MKYVVDRLNEIETFWVGTKRRIAQAAGVAYSEMNAMDVFEFFTLVSDCERDNKK